jgi:glutathione S-transferase
MSASVKAYAYATSSRHSKQGRGAEEARTTAVSSAEAVRHSVAACLDRSDSSSKEREFIVEPRFSILRLAALAALAATSRARHTCVGASTSGRPLSLFSADQMHTLTCSSWCVTVAVEPTLP